jgi:DNA-binding HxlR family transcriptional regulator
MSQPQIALSSLPPREQWLAINEHCPMAQMFEVVGTRTAFLLLREAFYGATRFDQFVERAEISEPVAAARLKELVDAGLLERFAYQEPGQRSRDGYRLTDKGSDMVPVLVAMVAWGDRWVFDGHARGKISHVGCGEQVKAVLRCDEGHDVTPADLELRLHRRPKLRPAASAA